MGGALLRAALAAGIDARPAGRDDLEAVAGECELALLCVPDGEIEPAAARLAGAARLLRAAGHVSGATGLEALAAPAARGALTFSLHPLQTVPDPGASVAGAPAAVSGSDERALRVASRLAEALGMRQFELSEDARAAYHAAASIASNFLVSLEESAAELLEAAGLEAPRELLAPLVLRTAANWSERGADALTGPIARGDSNTVSVHREAISRTAPELLPLYDTLARRTRELAAEREGARR
jgi:predicted short-subunit dehydrogenase-like oxidoreductase (DUF2520 family)